MFLRVQLTIGETDFDSRTRASGFITSAAPSSLDIKIKLVAASVEIYNI